MHYVYTAPYGEDPFDMMQMLKEKYDLKKLYPAYLEAATAYIKLISDYVRQNILIPYAEEYAERMQNLWLK